MKEIERKFLINVPLPEILSNVNYKQLFIEQNYLGNTGEWTTRIRQTVCEGIITRHLALKRKINLVSCTEIETVIDVGFYNKMLSQCGPTLRKIRYETSHGDHLWEIDLFTDPKLDNLVIAEIEIQDENEVFDLPTWVGKEVTQDRQYKNARLVKKLI